MTVVCWRIADSGIVDAETRTAVRPVDQFSFPIIHPFRKTFAVVVQQSHWNLRDIIAEGIQRIVVFLLHLFAVLDILVHQTLSLLQSCGEGLRTIGIHLVLISLIECGSLPPLMSILRVESAYKKCLREE